ncbi:hypothetical protein [Sphingobium nicotianae]|uniref:Uncharacterized protein n=1 Tax=Sphingobium nicotianae TaxID=2782607 RepID=A0A9X1DCC6_9SPHN|nr:hypothetical protein [Sphingobium nicotianae]MBT2187083.1 hypothetical protein [Sphingobium nicotianae]
MSELPAWPAKLTREQKKAVKQRSKNFDAALKGASRAAGWRFARGGVFRQTGDWFISILPSLLWERGALVRMMVKPMALDPLFWNIVGLSENEALPLSFRATGAWVLRPPSTEGHVGPNTMQVQPLATEVLDWGNRRAAEALQSISTTSMLSALPDEEHLRGQYRALAICVRIMMDDLDGAARLCRIADPAIHPLIQEAGGFTTHNSDGSVSSFLDQARDWIARNRREELRLA